MVGFGIPFLLVFTLAIEAGGYDVVLRSQIGIVVWWGVLLGLAAGLLPSIRLNRAAWVAIATFAGLTLITAVATLTWTESAERSVLELSRTVTLFGVFLLLLLTQGREGFNRTVAAVAAAAALVAVVALADRFDPGLLPFGSSVELPADYPRARLNWPLEYWNGLGALMAISLGPLLWLTTSARHPFARSLSAAAIPLIGLAIFMTASRGGALAAALALLAILVLTPERIRLLVCSAGPAVGALLLVMAVNSRPEVRDLIPSDLAASQGNEMLWICLAVAIATGGIQALITGLIERGALRLPTVDRELTRMVGAGFAFVALVLVIVGLATGFFADRWTDFKQPVADQANVSRLASISSSERYLYWDAALGAAGSEPLTGVGPGTFEYWWAAEGEGQFARDAHSLFLEGLAEMGPVALILLLVLILGPIGFGIRLSLARRSNEERAVLAAAVAGMAAFALSAGIDWAWELTVLPVAFFALAAAVLARGGLDDQRGERRTQPGSAVATQPGSAVADGTWTPLATALPSWARGLGVAAALLAIVIIYVPMKGVQDFDTSQELVRAGDLEGALAKAESSSDRLPWAASPRIQQAQILQLLGRKPEAVAEAREAVDKEQVNWRNWLVLSQILAGDYPVRSELALRRALALNPRSEYLRGLIDQPGGSQ